MRTAVFLLFAVVQAIKPLHLHIREAATVSPVSRTNQLLLPFETTPTSRTQWISQPLDHFAPAGGTTWNQRYLINSTFFDGTGPVFLCVGGEGPGFTEDVVISGTEHAHEMILAAEQHGALILALEHRYYGQSLPTKDFSTANLKWLSSPQALEDLAAFVAHINAQHGLQGQTNRWITFGGSYPGMMASFARLKYPHLIYGSIASSAPVQAVSNMQGYMDVMSENFKLADVGGSETCYSAIKDAFTEVGTLLQPPLAEGRSTLYSLFGICDQGDPLKDPDEQVGLVQTLSFIFPAQSNDPLCDTPGCNIKSMCSAYMANTTVSERPIERLAAFYKQMSGGGGQCTSIDYYAENIAPLLNTTLAGGTARIWTYQTCTEYGFYQTCDPGTKCIFTSAPHLNTLDSYYDQCQKAFGISGLQVEEAVKSSNIWSGGWHPGSSRVLYINGQVDPWRSQGVLPDNKAFGKVVPVGAPDSGISALMVEGSSHHYWTHATIEPDPPILAARASVNAQLATWLK